MKWCGCKAREATETVVFQTRDGKTITARFCRPCWDRERASMGDKATVKALTTVLPGEEGKQ